MLLTFRKYLLSARNHAVFQKPSAEGCLLLLPQKREQSYGAKKGTGKVPMQQHPTSVLYFLHTGSTGFFQKEPDKHSILASVGHKLTITQFDYATTVHKGSHKEIATEQPWLSSFFSFCFCLFLPLREGLIGRLALNS